MAILPTPQVFFGKELPEIKLSNCESEDHNLILPPLHPLQTFIID
ncbi:hypothetical protein [Tolypothrix tenuis]